MARRADGRVNSTDRTKRYTPDTFEDGSAVRRLAAQPQEAPKEARPLKSGVSSQTRRNRALKSAEIGTFQGTILTY